MNDTSAEIQVYFLRHGKPFFDYDNREYDDFIDMLSNGHKVSLAENPEIDFESLPKQADFIGYSPITRAAQTAKILQPRLGVRSTSMMEMVLLGEVKFDRDIIKRHEFTSLAESREDILKRWYDGSNKAETFENSLARVRKIEAYLRELQKETKTIILVTHGWFLRLLDVYFVKGKRTDITFDDILNAKPVPLGHCITATVTRKNSKTLSLETMQLVRKPVTKISGWS